MSKQEVMLSKLDTLDENLTATLQAPKLDPILLTIANDYLANKTIPEIADTYGISPDRVTKVLEHKDVKEYVNQVFLTQGYLHRNKRLDLINTIIEKKLEEAMETGMYSKVDIFYWLKQLEDIESNLRPKKESPAVAVQINNNYQDLVKKLSE